MADEKPNPNIKYVDGVKYVRDYSNFGKFRPILPPKKKKSPAMAGALAILPLGAGHIYAGKWPKGLGFNALEVVTFVPGYYVFLAGILGDSEPTWTLGAGLILTSVGIKVWEVCDAVNTVNKHNSKIPKVIRMRCGIAPIQNNVGLTLAYKF